MNIEQTVKDYPTAHPLGFTLEEIEELLTEFENIHVSDFGEKLLSCTIGDVNGKHVYYRKDIIRLIKRVRVKQIIG